MTPDRVSFDPRRVRGIVFDLDGTLVDSYRAIAASLNHARRSFGLGPLPEATVRRSVGRGLECLVAELVDRDHVEAAVGHFREHYARVYLELTVALPGAARTLEHLDGCGYGLAVASNKPARFGRPILEALGLVHHLREVEGPDRVGSTKPHPAMLDACMTALGVSPGETLYVGDMTLDAETGRRAGVPVVLVAGGSSSEAELRETGWPVVADLLELTRLLPGIP